MMYTAKQMPTWARAACRDLGFMPDRYEITLAFFPPSAEGVVIILRAWRGRRSVSLSNLDYEKYS